jgi:hypothetical protein
MSLIDVIKQLLTKVKGKYSQGSILSILYGILFTGEHQGCQIFLSTKYQSGENIPNDNKITKGPKNNK